MGDETSNGEESKQVDGEQIEEKEDDGWLDILDNKQILKKVLKEGDQDVPRPERGCRVRINLDTKLKETGERVESECYQDAAIFVGDCDIIHGLDMIIPLMHLNEKAIAVIAARFAYGDKGREPDIPGDATLECEIELLNIEWVEDFGDIDKNERLEIGEKKKEKGNFHFHRGEWVNSISAYKKCIEILNIDPNEFGDDKTAIDNFLQLRVKCFNNLAQAQMNIKAFDQALASINSALEIDPDNLKALFRKGKILEAKGDIQEAVPVWEAALKLDPSSMLLRRELDKAKKEKKKQLAEEKIMFKKMLQLDDKPDTNQTQNLSNSKKWLSMKPNMLVVSSVAFALLGVFLFTFVY